MVREIVVENEKKEWRSPKVKEICLFNTEGKPHFNAAEITHSPSDACAPS